MRAVSISKAAAVAIALAAIQQVQAADLSREQTEMQRAIDDAQKKSQSGSKSYSLQSVGPNVDRNLQSFSSGANALKSCASAQAAFASQYTAQLGQMQSILGNVNQLLSNPVLKAIAGPAVESILPSATSVVQQLSSTCQTMSTAKAGGNSKYQQVSQVMKREFSGGDLSANSPAVKHAADVDMPARGGTPDSLRAYLNSQNGAVKKWYRDNYQLK